MIKSYWQEKNAKTSGKYESKEIIVAIIMSDNTNYKEKGHQKQKQTFILKKFQFAMKTH